MMTIYFRCQHTLVIGDRSDASPRCPTCGDTRVTRVQTSRPPRFVGTVTGPYAETKGLEPGVVNVAPGGPLILKETH